jgi:hypothetical protein
MKEKNPSAVMMWFQNGKLWNSRVDAQEAMIQRGLRGRQGDARQGGFRDRKSARPDWKPKTSETRRSPKGNTDRGPRRSAEREGPLEWKPKGEFVPAPKRSERPDWKPKSEGRWSPKGDTDRGPRRSAKREGGLEWKPKGEAGSRQPASGDREKRKWVPKEEYKKSQGIEARRDKNWRPGGEHKDPRQKYKDAKKAKWSRFKQNIRTRWEQKSEGPRRSAKREGGQGKKRKDEE